MNVRSVDYLSKKKRAKKKIGNVPDADTSSPSPSSAEAVSEQPAQTGFPIDLSTVDPQKIKMAEDLGIPIGQILQWMGSVEARFQAIAENMPTKEDIPKAFEQAIENARQKQIERMKSMPQGVPQGGGMGGISQLIPMLLGGGGGQDAEMTQLSKDIMKMSLDRMKADIGFTEAIKQAVVTKIAGKAVGKII